MLLLPSWPVVLFSQLLQWSCSKSRGTHESDDGASSYYSHAAPRTPALATLLLADWGPQSKAATREPDSSSFNDRDTDSMLKFPTTNHPVSHAQSLGMSGQILAVPKVRLPAPPLLSKLCFFFYLPLATILRSLRSSCVCSAAAAAASSRANGLWIGVYENICLGCVLRLLGETPYCVVSIWAQLCILRAFKARLIIARGNFK